MPVTVAQHFEVPVKKIAGLGAFNSFLDLDSKLFINPTLLKNTKVPEFATAYTTVLDHFQKILTLLASSDRPGDLCWKEAGKRLRFPEIQGTCIGYSQGGTGGHGLGPKLRDGLLATLHELVKKGLNDPRIFELVSLFQEDIGCDLISDMVAYVLRKQIFGFSAKVTKSLELKGGATIFDGESYSLATNPFNRRPVLFLPTDILDDLPQALSWDDIYKVTAKNEEVRSAISRIIGFDWAKSSKKIFKYELRNLFIREPNVLREILASENQKRRKPYDLAADPAGKVSWHETAVAYASANPLLLHLQRCPKLDDVYTVVGAICENFRVAIEDRGFWKNLYKQWPKPHHESYAQRMFQTIAELRCKDNNLDLSPESNRGNGPVDFKISHGNKATVLVEIKLSTNHSLVKGYTKQLEAYRRAEGAVSTIYLVIDVGRSDARLKEVIDTSTKATKKDRAAPRLIIIDGKKQRSASKL